MLTFASFRAAGIRPVTGHDWIMFALCPTAGSGRCNGPANWIAYDYAQMLHNGSMIYTRPGNPWCTAFYTFPALGGFAGEEC